MIASIYSILNCFSSCAHGYHEIPWTCNDVSYCPKPKFLGFGRFWLRRSKTFSKKQCFNWDNFQTFLGGLLTRGWQYIMLHMYTNTHINYVGTELNFTHLHKSFYQNSITIHYSILISTIHLEFTCQGTDQVDGTAELHFLGQGQCRFPHARLLAGADCCPVTHHVSGWMAPGEKNISQNQTPRGGLP